MPRLVLPLAVSLLVFTVIQSFPVVTFFAIATLVIAIIMTILIAMMDKTDRLHDDEPSDLD